MTEIRINIPYLFNLVNQRSLYVADHVDPEISRNTIEKIPLTMDEYDAFLVLMRNGATEVFKKISRLSYNIVAPFTYETVEADVDVEATTNILYKVVFGDTQQTEIIIPIITDNIQRALRAFIIMEWFKMKGVSTTQMQLDQYEWDYCTKELSSIKDYSKRAKVKYHYF